jgi:molybdopterin synthase sulfur carrier subunit
LSVRVRIPAPLRSVTAGESEVSVAGGSVAEALSQLEARFPDLTKRLRDEDGELRRFVNLYVNGEDIRFLAGLQTSLETGDEMSIIPAVAGGCWLGAD